MSKADSLFGQWQQPQLVIKNNIKLKMDVISIINNKKQTNGWAAYCLHVCYVFYKGSERMFEVNADVERSVNTARL